MYIYKSVLLTIVEYFAVESKKMVAPVVVRCFCMNLLKLDTALSYGNRKYWWEGNWNGEMLSFY